MANHHIKQRAIAFLGFSALISWAFLYNSRGDSDQNAKFNDKPAPQALKIFLSKQINTATVRKSDKDWKANSNVIKHMTGKSPRYCRPPGGDFSKTTVQLAASLGITTVFWTDDPGDYANPGDQILLNRVTKSLKPGAIVLIHDGSQNTLDTLTEFIKIARSKGFTFVSLSGLSK